MNTTCRPDALAVLAEIAALAPDIRLGQLFAHIGFLSEDELGLTLWDVDDDQLLTVLRRHQTELSNRLSDSHATSVAGLS